LEIAQTHENNPAVQSCVVGGSPAKGNGTIGICVSALGNINVPKAWMSSGITTNGQRFFPLDYLESHNWRNNYDFLNDMIHSFPSAASSKISDCNKITTKDDSWFEYDYVPREVFVVP
jgi:hypothetical protein